MSVYTHSTIINTRDTDLLGQCRPSALMGYLQEAGTLAAVDVGLTREAMLEKYGCFWMLSRLWYHLDAPLFGAEELTIRTWHRGGKGAALYRDFDLYRDGKQVGEAVSIWVLASAQNYQLFRLSNVSEVATSVGVGLAKEKKLHALRPTGEMVLAEERRLHYSETDINGHINNTRYADFACDALGLEDMERNAFVTEMQVGFLAQCRAKEVLDLHVSGGEGTRFVHGVGQDGVTRFDAAVTVAQFCP